MSERMVGIGEAFLQGFGKRHMEDLIEEVDLTEDQMKQIYINDLKEAYNDVVKRMIALQEMILKL